jgi:hypothetical protein
LGPNPDLADPRRRRLQRFRVNRSRAIAALIGMMYDLKQTPTRQPSNIHQLSYWDVLDEFLTKHWDKSVLDRYDHVSHPLYTTEILENKAKPTRRIRWAIQSCLFSR